MTNQQAIDQALFFVGVIQAGASGTATDSADALRLLNQMMAQWALDDKDLQFPPQDTLADTFPIPLWAEEGVVANLAIRSAAQHGKPVSNDLFALAKNGRDFIAKTLINTKLESKDMSHMPVGTGARWNILTDTLR